MARLTTSDLKNMGLLEVNGVYRKVKGAESENKGATGKKQAKKDVFTAKEWNERQSKPQNRESKYKNKRCQDELGNKFDSQKELKRWGELQLLYHAGEITELRRQVPFELNEGGVFKYRYKADFTYYEKGKYVVEDSKGTRTACYKKKCKLMLKVHGITIRET